MGLERRATSLFQSGFPVLFLDLSAKRCISVLAIFILPFLPFFMACCCASPGSTCWCIIRFTICIPRSGPTAHYKNPVSVPAKC